MAAMLGSREEETPNGKKSRKEMRKDARKEKKQRNLQSWLQYKNANRKKKETSIEPPKPSESKLSKKRKKDPFHNSIIRVEETTKPERTLPRNKKEEKSKTKIKKKTKFEEFLEMDKSKNASSDQFDLEMEKKLTKKLKIKNGKLGGFDDGLDMLLDGIPSALDDEGESRERILEDTRIAPKKGKKSKKETKSSNVDDGLDMLLDGSPSALDDERESRERFLEETCIAPKKRKKMKDTKPSNAEEGSAKYVAPHLRACSSEESEEISQMRRRVRGLLNRLSESNIESITQEIADIYQTTSRSASCKVVSEEVLSSCSQGPRGNEQYAAVFAAFVSGMACSVGIDFGAKLMASLARSLEEEYEKEDGLSLRNLTLLFSYLHIFGICGSDLVYDFLSVLSERLTELDVSTILTILQCCGMKLRASDPIAMKEFIISVQSKVDKLDAPNKGKRMEFMLETICDIKNNKKKVKEDPAHHARIKKWLHKLRVDDITLKNLTWAKLLDPEKRGQWWLATDGVTALAGKGDVKEVAVVTERQPSEAQQLVQLAAAQRMNTDVRRAIFCIIISAEDYIDAFEKILRLDLSGKQDREIMRVVVECCLQEKVFNRYYAILAAKFCSHDKNHKFTLQYCLWDHYKELDTMEPGRSLNLARLTSEMLTSFTLSLAALKVVDFSTTATMSARRAMHFRIMFEELMAAEEKVLWNMFTRIAGSMELEELRSGMEFFISRHVVGGSDASKEKFNFVKKAMKNVEGVLL